MEETKPLQTEQERRAILLSLINHDGFGLEVGPSYSPLLPKSQGYNVETLDYTSAEALRIKYSGYANVDVSKIEDVDYISDGRGLLDIIGKPENYDYIVASHVIEHVTDIVRFIQDCESLLKPNGTLLLAVPDKRFCFDAMRPLSTVGEALQAYTENRTRHTPGQVFDYFHSLSKNGGRHIWADTTLDKITLDYSPEYALENYIEAKDALNYIDIHAWRFTPSHFRYIIKTLRSLSFIESGDTIIITNDDSPIYRFEFYAALSKLATINTTPDIDLLRSSEKELREIGTEGSSLYIKEISELKERISELSSELRKKSDENDALLSSSSWKLTRPLRYLKSLIGR
ncbi:methyltransferase domain-containing protein [Rhizobium sp. RHZ01]|uniref:methyltransferase domain-containing protein n=1 Tax=Rhizobium sp. RHZ01 TaxID=2769304 RepID=UPI001782A474|nr:methyltransferase domain-containing protein [Rhizobium sp. RHZ01]MBD9449814.1 methyltransferase domain-containing protein [Rhizobium sp. RHZ01]